MNQLWSASFEIALTLYSPQAGKFYTLPQRTDTIIIEYDHVCRPYIYQKTWYGKREIWTYPGSGFMETVSFGVEWLPEDEFQMIYDDKDDEFDEEYIITIPK